MDILLERMRTLSVAQQDNCVSEEKTRKRCVFTILFTFICYFINSPSCEMPEEISRDVVCWTFGVNKRYAQEKVEGLA